MSTKDVITASDLQRSSGKVLKRVAVGNEHLVIERAGYPVAVLLSYQEYEALMQDRALAAHRVLIEALGQEAEKQNLDEAALMIDLETEKRQVYQKTYGE